MEAVRKSFKRKAVKAAEEAAYMRAGERRASAAVAEPRAYSTATQTRVGMLRHTSEEVAARNPEVPFALAMEMVVVVRSCPNRGIDIDLMDANEALRHVREESCERCVRRVEVRRRALQRSGVLEEEKRIATQRA